MPSKLKQIEASVVKPFHSKRKRIDEVNKHVYLDNSRESLTMQTG